MSLGLYCIFKFFCLCTWLSDILNFIYMFLSFFLLSLFLRSNPFLFIPQSFYSNLIQISFSPMCVKCVWLNFAPSFLALIVCVLTFVNMCGLSFHFTLCLHHTLILCWNSTAWTPWICFAFINRWLKLLLKKKNVMVMIVRRRLNLHCCCHYHIKISANNSSNMQFTCKHSIIPLWWIR